MRVLAWSGNYDMNPEAAIGAFGASFVFPLPLGFCRDTVGLTCRDTLKVEGKIYKEVFVFTCSYCSKYHRPPLNADTLYYTKSDGIIKVILTDRETFSLMP